MLTGWLNSSNYTIPTKLNAKPKNRNGNANGSVNKPPN